MANRPTENQVRNFRDALGFAPQPVRRPAVKSRVSKSTDKQRLDWLEERQTSLEFMDWRKSKPWVMGHKSTAYAASNPRAAIDAAIKAEKEKRRG